MLKPRVFALVLMGLSALAGCQWGKSTAWSDQPRRNDDPLLSMDANRSRSREPYSTTSDSRFTSPIVAPAR